AAASYSEALQEIDRVTGPHEALLSFFAEVRTGDAVAGGDAQRLAGRGEQWGCRRRAPVRQPDAVRACPRRLRARRAEGAGLDGGRQRLRCRPARLSGRRARLQGGGSGVPRTTPTLRSGRGRG